jgi:hypothetical protein
VKAPRWLWLVALASVAWQLVLAARTPVPSEDGVSYLWMAQQFAGGGWRDALSMVFPPGFPLLCAPWVALGLPVEAVGIGCGVLCTAATLWPIARIAEHFRPGAALPAALLFAASPLLPRVAVEVYSEPPFLLAVAWGTWCGLRARWWTMGVLAGIAFWIRPEGLLLPAAFLLAGRWGAFRSLVPAAAAVAALAALRAAAGHGFDPLPILAFHGQRDDLEGRGRVWENVFMLGAWFEAFGVAGALAFVRIAWARAREPAVRGAAVLWWQIALQVAVICTFVVRRRFLLSAAVPVLVFAGTGLLSLPRRWRNAVFVVGAAFGMVVAFRGTIDADRAVERELGRYLGAQLAPGNRISSNLARVVWFTGLQPPPPRRFRHSYYSLEAMDRSVQFLAISGSSEANMIWSEQPRGRFVLAELPEALAAGCRARDIMVLLRR